MKNLLSPGTVSRFYALLTLMLIALLLIMTGDANAATYYVSPDGNDDNAGTNDAPWATFQKAMPNLREGDTLLLKNGTYHQSLRVTVSGRSDKYITIKAENDGKAVVDGSLNGAYASLDPFFANNAHYIDVSGIVFKNGVQHVLQVWSSSYMNFRRVSASDAWEGNYHPIVTGSSSNILFEDCVVYGRGRLGIDIDKDSTNNTVRRCWVQMGDAEGNGVGIAAYNASNNIFENNIVTVRPATIWPRWHGMAAWGTDGHFANNNTFIGNVVKDATMDAFYTINSVGGYAVNAWNHFINNVSINSTSYGLRNANSAMTVWQNNTIAGTNNDNGAIIQESGDVTASNLSVLNATHGWYSYDGAASHQYNNYYDISSAVFMGDSGNATEYCNDPSCGKPAVDNPYYDAASYGYGAYLMVPPALKGIGADGSNIGAEVLYSYEDGILTAKPLWPWPMEDRVAAEVGVSVTYADDGNGHYGGLWGTIDGIYEHIVFASNSGGGQYTGQSGDVYQADAYYSGGYKASTTAAIAGTTDDTLYQSVRYGNFTYNIPLANGNYTVTLKFAEIYWTSAGQRIFNVSMQGTQVISKLDIFSKVGKNAAYDVSVPVTVANGTLNIIFTSVADQAKVSGIVVTAGSSPAAILFSPNALSFTASQGTNPGSRTITLTNSGGGALNWTAATDQAVPAWLSVSPGSGTGNGTLTVSVNSAALPAGTYTRAITVTAPGAVNSPRTVNVTLTVNPPGTTHYDFNYPDRASLIAAGWSYFAVLPTGVSRNTGQTTGAVVSYDQLLHPGILRIPADVGDLWGNENDTRNSLFRNLPSNWTGIRLKLAFGPTQNYQQAGLLAYQDDDNYVQVMRIYEDDNKVIMASETSDSAGYLGFSTVTATSDLHLRLDRDPATERITGYYSLDGVEWTSLDSLIHPLTNPRLAIVVGASPGGFPNADLSWAEVNAVSLFPSIQLSTSSLSFSTKAGEKPADRTIAISNGEGGTLNWTAKAENSSPEWLTISPAGGTGNATLTVSVDPAGLTPGTYTKTITIAAAGATNTPRAINVTLTVDPGNIVFATNSGGGQYTDRSGFVYKADTGYAGGSKTSTTSAISGTPDDALYQSVRYGNFSYNVPLANGSYSVTLKFAEIYWDAVGKRVFNVSMQGTQVIHNLDIFSKVGKNAAYDVSVLVSVTNGTLNINFTSVIDYAKVSAIVVTSTGGGQATIALNPALLNFTATAGTNPANQNISIGNSGGGTLNWSAAADSSLPAWLSVSPADGTGNVTVDVSVNSSGLPAGTYTKNITISASEATNTPQIVPVTLTVTPAEGTYIAINAAGGQYTSQPGMTYQADTHYSGGDTASTPAAISGTNDDFLYHSVRYGNFSYNIPLANGYYYVKLKFAEIYWTVAGKRVFNVSMQGKRVISNLDIFAKAGKNAAYDVVILTTVNNGALNINFSSVSDYAEVSAIEITESQIPPPPALALDKTELNFSAVAGTNSASQALSLSNSGGGTLNWTAATDGTIPEWLTISPASGTGNGALTISANSAELAAGTYIKTLTVAATDAENSPRTVNVILTVNPATITTPSPGHYDFTYPDRGSLFAAGWNFLAVSPSGAFRNTEQTTGAVVSYDQAAHPGILRIPADAGDLWSGSNNTINTLLRDLPADWTSIRLKLSFAPTQNYQQAGLLAYQDDNNYVQLTRTFNGGNAVNFAREINGTPGTLSSVPETATDLYLRLDRYPETDSISAYYSRDGSSWAAMGRVIQALTHPRLAIFIGASPDGFPNADLSWAEIYEGTLLQTIAVSHANLNFITSDGTDPADQTIELSASSAPPSPFTDYALSGASWTLSDASYDQETLLLSESSSVAMHHAFISSAYPLGKAAFVVEVKPAGRNWVRIGYDGYMYFDILNGTAGTSSNIAAYGIRPLDDGWYEISVVSTLNANDNADLVIANADNSPSYQGDGTSGVLVRDPRFVGFREGKSSAHILSASPVEITGPDYKYRGGIAMGDSFTAEANYTPHVNAASSHLLVADKGIGGQTLPQIVGRFDNDVAPYSPSFVLLMAGINDISTSVSDPVSSMQSQVGLFISKCNSINAVPVLTTLPPAKDYPDYWTPGRQLWMDTYNAWIISYAASKGLALLDLRSLLSADGITLNPSLDSGDHLHPNTTGYLAIANAIVALLDNVPLSATLNWTAAADPTEPAWLEVGPASGTGNSSITVSVNSTGLTPGTYTKAIVIAAPGAANTPQTVNVTLTVGPSTANYVATNSGGNAYTSLSGIVYQEDTNYSGGDTAWTTSAISGTSDDALYQTERFGNFSYNIPLENGNYTVTLRFAEIYWTVAGKRVFNVNMQGTQVINNLDIFSKVGKNAAYDVTLPVSVTNGTLNIKFSSIADYAMVSAIEVIGPE